MIPMRQDSTQVRCFLLILLTLFSYQVSGQTTVTVIKPQSVEDASHHYFVELLTLALKNGTHEGTTPRVEMKDFGGAGHESLYRLMDLGEVDVSWKGSNKARDLRFLPIRIPLMRGLLGYRVSIIHKNSLDSFKSNARFAMHNGIACQGKYWPDSDILEHNGFSVTRVTSFQTNFKLVNAGRCDYFPRAIFEGPAELSSVREQYPDLRVFDDTLIYYPFPFFYYTTKDKQDLADVIERGLVTMLENGEFDKFMMEHPITRHLFPLSKWQAHPFVTLKNPSLSPSSVFALSKYGLKLADPR